MSSKFLNRIYSGQMINYAVILERKVSKILLKDKDDFEMIVAIDKSVLFILCLVIYATWPLVMN